MAETTPISPPTSSTTDPTATTTKSTTFPHKTSVAVATSTPSIDTSTPAINAAPVELDGIPTSPAEASRKVTTDSKNEPALSRERKGSVVVSPGLDVEGEIEREFLGEGNVEESAQVKQKRADILANRSKDPGVIVDVPQYPTAAEVEAAKSADGVSTPNLEMTAGGEAK